MKSETLKPSVYLEDVVKTPTSTQHNPKTTSTDVGFDMNMTVQTTPPHPTHHRNSTLALERDQCSENKPNLRQSS